MFVLTRGFPNPLKNWCSPTGAQQLTICFLGCDGGSAPDVVPRISIISGNEGLKDILNLLILRGRLKRLQAGLFHKGNTSENVSFKGFPPNSHPTEDKGSTIFKRAETIPLHLSSSFKISLHQKESFLM
jgi:hypothetical protein